MYNTTNVSLVLVLLKIEIIFILEIISLNHTVWLIIDTYCYFGYSCSFTGINIIISDTGQ